VIVAGEVGTRNGDQCAKRWNENLNPELDHGPWSAAEDKLLLHLVQTQGNNWKSIAQGFFEARAPLSLKNRHSLLMRRRKRQESAAKQLPSPRNSESPTTFSVPPCGPFDLSSSQIVSPTTIDGSPFENSRVGQSVDMSALVGTTTGTSDGSGMSNCCAFSRTLGNPVYDDLSVARDVPRMSWEDENAGTQFAGSRSSTDNLNGNAGMDLDVIASENPFMSDQQHNHQAHLQGNVPSPDSDEEIRYSVTSPRGKLKTLAHHLVDAAIIETASRASEDELVTLTLRLSTG
jgi:hypothetical protein